MNPFRYHLYYRMVDLPTPGCWIHSGSFQIAEMASAVSSVMIHHYGSRIETLTHEGDRDDSMLPR